MLFLVLLIANVILFGGTSAVVANAKGRDGFSWFMFGALFGIFALVAVCAMPAIRRAEAAGHVDSHSHLTEQEQSALDWANRHTRV